jgi:hypothetical protein
MQQLFVKNIYIQGILGQFFPELTEEEGLYGWFQQDSATAHIAHMSIQEECRLLGCGAV